MFTRRSLVLVLLFAFTGAMAASAQELTLDQILDKNLAAVGGADAVRAVKTVTISGKMVMGGGQMEMAMLMQIKVPGKQRTEMTLQGRKIIAAVDGAEGWMINPMQGDTPQKMPEGQLKSAAQNSDLGSMLGALKLMRESGSTIELAGKEDVEGTPAYRIKVTLKSGDVQTVFLDAEKFLEIKLVSKMNQMGQEMEIESYPSNYRKVGNLMVPFAQDSKVGGRPMGQMIIDKVEFNLPMDDKIFQMPVTEPPAPAAKKQ